MPSSSPSTGVLIQSSGTRPQSNVRHRLPNLADPTRYKRIDRVPIIDTCERTYYKKAADGSQKKVHEVIDEDQLRVIYENSKFREEKGELGLTRIGHTDDEGPETSQPPLVGYVVNYEMGEHEGRPAILADVYLDRNRCDPSAVQDQYPKRSAEIVGLSSPKGYIDSVALLNRTPERDLGLITSHYSGKKEISRFVCPTCAEEEAEATHTDRKKKVVKHALELLKNLLEGVIDNPDKNSDDESTHSEMDDSVEYEPNEISGDSPMSKMNTSRKTSRYSADPSDSSGPSGDPSETPGTEVSGTPSETSPSGEEEVGYTHPSGDADTRKGKSHKHHERMDPEPSRMSKKSKYQAGGGSPPGPMTDMPSGEPSRMSHKSRHSSSKEVARMKRDSEAISTSRFAKELKARDETIAALKARLDDADAKARQSTIERKVAQLEYEGFELDRAEEVARLMLMPSDEDVDKEIVRMSKRYTRTALNQPMLHIPNDLGGSTLPVRQQDPRIPRVEDIGNDGVHIVGSGATSRFSRRAASDEFKITDDMTPTQIAQMVGRKLHAEQNKSRTG